MDKNFNDIFNDFLLSIINEHNVNLLREIRMRWKEYQGEIVLPQQSKQSPPTPSPKEERIEVAHITEASSRHYWWFTVNKECFHIPKDKLFSIKEAIEQVLNGDSFKITTSPNLFTQEYIDKAREDAFNAARLVGPLPFDHNVFATAADYIKSLNTLLK